MKRRKLTTFIFQKYSLFTFYVNSLKTLYKIFLPRTSYSEYGEDLIISKLVSGKKITYIDIGAGHPVNGSNTYFFYKSGIYGVTVEPIRFQARLQKIFRRKDLQINALVSESKKPRLFFEFNPMQYSTTSIEHFKKLCSYGMRARKIYKVDSVSINKVIDSIEKIPFFISIDCEGYDLEILKQIKPIKLKRAFAIILEISVEDNSKQIYKKMTELDFRLHFTTPRNAIFIKN